MFKHPGKKLRWTAYLVSLICIAAGAGGGYLLYREHELLACVLAVVAGLLAAWIFGLLISGFGELIEKTKDNNYLLSRIAAHTKDLQSMQRE